MALQAKWDLSSLLNGLSNAENKVDAAVRMFAETGALKLQNYAKQNAPWTDRTGHARQRLNSYVSAVSNGYKIALAHGVNYGIWLELAHEKRFSIIPQTINYVGSHDIMPGLAKLMDRLGGV